MKVLIYDIENMAALGWFWPPVYDTSIMHVEHPQHLLCLAYKWLGEKKVHTMAIWDYKLYNTDPHNDRELAKDFHRVISQADIVVGHNSDQFDNKMINAMFMRHELPPPLPYHTVDTKKAAKRFARFPSNKLDELGQEFGIGRKVEHEGFNLWLKVDNGDKKAHKRMLIYNRQDVRLTEQLYLKLLPWISNHPAANVLENRPEACPKCLGTKMHKVMKYRATNTNLYQYYRCKDCGGMAKSRIPEYKQATERMQYVN